MELGEPWSIKLPVWPKNLWWDEAQEHFAALTEVVEGKFWVQRLTPNTLVESLVPSAPIRVPLPKEFLDIMPQTVKFSLDHQWLAIVIKPTLIRLIFVNSLRDKQWSIDLSTFDPSVMEHTPEETPTHPLNKKPKKDTTGTILNVYFTDHGSIAQDLVVVTTKGLFCYKCSIKKSTILFTYSFPHTSTNAVDGATRCWWDDESRCCVVALENSKNNKLALRGFFFPASKVNNTFTGKELPPPDKLPDFFTETDNVDKLYLVEVYDEPFMLELGDNVLNLYHLDIYSGRHVKGSFEVPNAFPIHDPESIYVCVLDDVICVSCRNAKRTVMLDAQAGVCFVTTQTLSRDEDLEFYSPNFCLERGDDLDGDDGALVYPIVLKLEKLVSSKTETTMATFLLRRSEDWHLAHELAFDELEAQIQGNIDDERKLNGVNGTKSVRRRWMDDVFGIYQPEWLEKDWQASVDLVFKAALLPGSAELRHSSDIALPPGASNLLKGFPKDFLPQTDVIKQLMEHAQQALQKSDDAKLRVLTDAAIDMIGAVTSIGLEPCPALICFTATLLWRLGDVKEFLAMLRSYIRSSAANTKPYQFTGNAILAEVMIAIVTDVELGCKTRECEEIHTTRNGKAKIQCKNATE